MAQHIYLGGHETCSLAARCQPTAVLEYCAGGLPRQRRQHMRSVQGAGSNRWGGCSSGGSRDNYCLLGRSQRRLHGCGGTWDRRRQFIPGESLRAVALASYSRPTPAARSRRAMENRTIPLDEDALHAQLKKEIKQKATKQALETLHVMRGEGILPRESTYKQLISHLCNGKPETRQAREKEALKVFEDLDACGLRLNPSANKALALAAVREDKVEAALKLLERVEQQEGANGGQLSMSVYTALINALSRKNRSARQRKTAELLWEKLRSSEVTLDTTAYNAGINMYAVNGNMEKARAMVEELRGASEAGNPDACTYNILLKGFDENATPTECLAILQDMEDAGVMASPETYNSLVTTLVKAGDVNAAEQVLRAALKNGRQPGLPSYCSLIKGYSKEGRVHDALKLLAGMKLSGVSPNVYIYTAMVSCCAGNGYLEDALELLKEMRREDLNPTHVTYNALIAGYVKERRMDEAEEWVAEMMAQGVKPDEHTYNTLLAGYVSHQEDFSARHILDEMSMAGFRADRVTYTTLIKAAGKAGQVELAEELFAKLRTIAEPDVAAYSVMIDVHVRGGSMAAAQSWYKELLQTDTKPSVPVYGSLLRGFRESHDVESGVEIYSEMLRRGTEPDKQVYDDVIYLLVLDERFEEALELLQRMEAKGMVLNKTKYIDMYLSLTSEAERQQLQVRGQLTGDTDAKATMRKSRPARNGRKSSRASRVADGDDEMSWNSALESFKFWLGLPNSKYSSEWDPDRL
eukprot:scaffold7266_cov403-Prasinococcus_capsulatus_cf.AAC.5